MFLLFARGRRDGPSQKERAATSIRAVHSQVKRPLLLFNFQNLAGAQEAIH